jgi:hypothetical protein
MVFQATFNNVSFGMFAYCRFRHKRCQKGRLFISRFRYTEDVVSLNNSKFVDGIYPFELKLRDTLPETRVQWGKIHTPKLNEK